MKQYRTQKEAKRVVNCFSLFTILCLLLLAGCVKTDIYITDDPFTADSAPTVNEWEFTDDPSSPGTTGPIKDWTVNDNGDIIMETQGYSIGDYYPDPNVTFDTDGSIINGTPPIGVVFWLESPVGKNKHGKIVSLDEPQGTKAWGEAISTGASSLVDGEFNMSKIKALDVALFPAFKWCDDLTEGGKKWHLPAKDELLAVYAQKNILNAKLLTAKKTPLSNNSYWSSSEEHGSYAWMIPLSGGAPNYLGKGSSFSVRAITAF